MCTKTMAFREHRAVPGMMELNTTKNGGTYSSTDRQTQTCETVAFINVIW